MQIKIGQKTRLHCPAAGVSGLRTHITSPSATRQCPPSQEFLSRLCSTMAKRMMNRMTKNRVRKAIDLHLQDSPIGYFPLTYSSLSLCCISLYPFSPDSLLLRAVEFDLIELRSMNYFELSNFALSPLREVDFDLWQFALRSFDLFQLRSFDLLPLRGQAFAPLAIPLSLRQSCPLRITLIIPESSVCSYPVPR